MNISVLSQALLSSRAFKKIPENGVCSSKVQAYDLAVYPALSSQDLEHLVAEARNNSNLHITSESFLLCKYEVQRFVSIRLSVKDKLDIKYTVLCVDLLILLKIYCDYLRGHRKQR